MRIYSERDKSESGSFAQELLNLFLQNEPAPGIEHEYRLVKQLPTITNDDVSAMTRDVDVRRWRVVLATALRKKDWRRDRGGPARHSPRRIPLRSPPGATRRRHGRSSRTSLGLRPSQSRREIPDVGVTIIRFSNGSRHGSSPRLSRTTRFSLAHVGRRGVALLRPMLSWRRRSRPTTCGLPDSTA